MSTTLVIPNALIVARDLSAPLIEPTYNVWNAARRTTGQYEHVGQLILTHDKLCLRPVEVDDPYAKLRDDLSAVYRRYLELSTKSGMTSNLATAHATERAQWELDVAIAKSRNPVVIPEGVVVGGQVFRATGDLEKVTVEDLQGSRHFDLWVDETLAEFCEGMARACRAAAAEASTKLEYLAGALWFGGGHASRSAKDMALALVDAYEQRHMLASSSKTPQPAAQPVAVAPDWDGWSL